MVKIGLLEKLKQKSQAREVVKITELPSEITVYDRVMYKAYAIEDIVRELYGDIEWYGYLIANKENPELVIDLYLPESQNHHGHTNLTTEEILRTQKQIPLDKVIIGWIHSHNSMGLKEFSRTDKENMETLATTLKQENRQLLRIEEVKYKNLTIIDKERYQEQINNERENNDLRIILVAKPVVEEVTFFDKVLGTFVYSILIGKDKRWHFPWSRYFSRHAESNGGRWHNQMISYLEESLMRPSKFKSRYAKLNLVWTDTNLSDEELKALIEEVKEKINGPNWSIDSYNADLYNDETKHEQELEVRDLKPEYKLSIVCKINEDRIKEMLREKPRLKPKKSKQKRWIFTKKKRIITPGGKNDGKAE